ncbi:MAG: hypothetical protein AAF236_07100 [Verrucomicrobiota bacterium]
MPHSLFGLRVENLSSDLGVGTGSGRGALDRGPVEILYEKLPTYVGNPLFQTETHRVFEDHSTYDLPQFPGFRLRATGDSIQLEEGPEGFAGRLDFFLLFLVVGLAGTHLHRGNLCLHGNALTDGESALAILGPREAGKSTQSRCLFERGYGFVCDDLCAIDFSGEKAQIHSGVPFMKLWHQSLAFFPSLAGSDYAKLFDSDKHLIPIEPKRFRQGCHPLRKLYTLDTSPNITAPTIRELSGMEKLTALAEHLYKLDLHLLLPHFPWVLKKLTRLANGVAIAAVERPGDAEFDWSVAELIDRDFREG